MTTPFDREQPEVPARTRFVDPAPAPAPPSLDHVDQAVPEVVEAPRVAPETAPEPTQEPTQEPTPEPTPEPEQALVQVWQEPEPVGPDAPAPGRALVAALAAVVVLLAGLAGFLGWRVVDTAGKGPVEQSRTDAVAAARKAAPLVFSYDYRHLDKDFAAGKAVTTGQFQSEYAKTTTKLVSDVAPRYKAVVVAEVSAISVVQASERSVVTLVFVNQSSASTLNAQPKITTSRLEMTMVKRGNRWLVSRIKAL